MLSDNVSIALALFAVWIAAKPPTPDRTFGFKRVGILAALANGATLVAVSLWIFYAAIQRFRDPPDVLSGWMLTIAIVGLFVNVASAFVLARSRGGSLNLEAAFRHVLADLAGSVGVIAAAVVIILTGWLYADPLISVLIGLLVLASAWSILRDSTLILLEATPEGLDADEIGRTLASVEGVVDVHDLHVWTITSGFPAFSAHVLVRPAMTATSSAGSSRNSGASASRSSTQRSRSITRRPVGCCGLIEGKAAGEPHHKQPPMVITAAIENAPPERSGHACSPMGFSIMRQHGKASGAHEAPDEHGGQTEENDVEDGRVVPSHAPPRRPWLPFLGHESERLEDELDDERRADHRRVEGGEQEACGSRAVGIGHRYDRAGNASRGLLYPAPVCRSFAGISGSGRRRLWRQWALDDKRRYIGL
jgi:cation diffusion facilitator family transporter